MPYSALKYFKEVCEQIEKEGLTKNEKVITSPQGAKVHLDDNREVINMCANNYLGLANNPEIIEAAKKSYDEYRQNHGLDLLAPNGGRTEGCKLVGFISGLFCPSP